jgi:hypothetical protein
MDWRGKKEMIQTNLTSTHPLLIQSTERDCSSTLCKVEQQAHNKNQDTQNPKLDKKTAFILQHCV